MIKIKLMIFSIILLTSCSTIEIKQDIVETSLTDEVKIIQISDLHINKDKKIYKT